MKDEMATLKLPFTRHDKDARGNVRWYFVREGQKKVRLNPRGVQIGSPEFFQRYKRAHDGSLKPKQRKAEYRPGTFAHLIDSYLKSAHFDQLARRTQQMRRRTLLSMAAEHGERPAMMTPAAIRAGRDARAGTPAEANVRVKILSALYTWAIEAGLADDNPAKGIKRLKEGPGFHTWTAEEIELYRAKWPLGTRPRLAMELLYGLAARRGDVVKLGPQHIAGSTIRMVQEKTGRSLVLPITPELAEAIRTTPPGKPMLFLGYKSGDSFGGQFAQWVAEAGLPKRCTSHGLRKARATQLAESGATAHQIAAVTGHVTLSEVQRYTKDADQTRLAREAFGEQNVPSGIPINQSGTFSKGKDK